MTRMDYLMLMFLPWAVQHIVTLTNVHLLALQTEDNMNIGEWWQFVGLLLLVTRVEFFKC